MRKQRSLGKMILLAAAILVPVACLGIGILAVGPLPEIRIAPGAKSIGRRTPIVVEVKEPGRGLSHVKIELQQGERVDVLAERQYTPRSAFAWWGDRTSQDTFSLEVGRDSIAGLRNGEASLRVVAARVPTWLRRPDPAIAVQVMTVRLTPPALSVLSTKTYAAQGGCEAVVYAVGPTSVKDGVEVGDLWFPGFPLPGGSSADRFALFALPYDQTDPKPRLVAVDDAANRAETSFVDLFFPKPFKTDTIQVTDAFMEKVVPSIMANSPEVTDRGGLLENYLEINGELRRKNAGTLRNLARNSRSEFLWNSPFMMMPNAKVMSAFADRRTYTYEGRVVDHQDHLGYDLAVTRRADVPAANGGIVVLARYFGIYGNTVVLDHGYGLSSLYAHLAALQVKEGDRVTRGQILGQTGETGLAGGDHLHFTVLLQGLPVNPVEWWDGHWIADRIARKLGSALPFQE